MSSASAITPLEMARYQATARQRAVKRQQALDVWRQRARETSKRAAALLKAHYGVSRVVLFGSLSRAEPFSPHSDIDLAAWGLDERVYYRAVSRLLDLDPAVSIDLLRAEELSPQLLRVIETEGTPL